MKTLLALAFLATAITTPAFADEHPPVQACSADKWNQGNIEDNVPEAERLAVKNLKDEVVGAFHYDPATGDLFALYLCGSNSGYYYAEGNIFKGEVSTIHNDEYDSVIEAELEGTDLYLQLKTVYFTGSPEYADFEPFGAVLKVAVPAKK